MQRITGFPQAHASATFDPVQRAEQWKQVILKEEAHIAGEHAGPTSERPPLVPGATAIGQNHRAGSRAGVRPPRPGSNPAGPGQLGAAGAGGAPGSARSRGPGSARSHGSHGSHGSRRSGLRSGGRSVVSVRSGQGGGTARSRRSGTGSLASSRSSGSVYSRSSYGSSVSSRSRTSYSGSGSITGRSDRSSVYSFGSSLPSSASGMTAVALQRLERLEQSLDEERSKRVTAEKQLETLRRIVDERLTTLGGEAAVTSARQGSAARGGSAK